MEEIFFIGIKTADVQFLTTPAHSQMALCSFTNNHSPFILTSHILVLYTDDHRGFVLNAVTRTMMNIIYTKNMMTIIYMMTMMNIFIQIPDTMHMTSSSSDPADHTHGCAAR